MTTAAERYATSYPPDIVTAYKAVESADHRSTRYEALLNLGWTVIDTLWRILRSEYVERRERVGPAPEVETLLQQLKDKASQGLSWGDDSKLLTTCWKALGTESRVNVSPKSNKGRKAVRTYVEAWESVKEVWKANRHGIATLDYPRLLPNFSVRKSDGHTNLGKFFTEIVNARNVRYHGNKCVLVQGEPPFSITLNASYYETLNPLLLDALTELLDELEEPFTRYRWVNVLEVRKDPKEGCIARVRKWCGLLDLHPEVADPDERLQPGDVWLFDLEDRPVLRIHPDDVPQPWPIPEEVEATVAAAATEGSESDEGAPLPIEEHGLAAATQSIETEPVRLEQIKSGMRLLGLTPTGTCSVEAVTAFGDGVVQVIYLDAHGNPGKRLLYRDDEVDLRRVAAGRPWSFDGDGEILRLVLEAQRIRLAWYFDPYLAISTSVVDPLPHQISAVYEHMLPRQPLRFLLADDPGAGKTIMAGLLIKELMVRGDLERCLIVVPGSLSEQWQDELAEKFGMEFTIFSRELVRMTQDGNPFRYHDRLIIRLDQLSRSEDDLQLLLQDAPEWDLIVCDEAHRMSATYLGNELKRTKRYKLGQLLGERCRNFLLMTATPHNGKDEDFQLFLSLLDGDRFEGRYRDGVHAHSRDARDLMRRLTKEDLYRFDGRKLFPERKSYTPVYELSELEAQLYTEVTEYVREEMNRAERIEDQRRVNVGFALMTLQRRLASSPRAIFRSIERRRGRLEERLGEERIRLRGGGASKAKFQERGVHHYSEDEWDELYEDAPQEEREEKEAELVDLATAARTVEELETEILSLQRLEALARRVVNAKTDAKWGQLREILDDPKMKDEAGNQRKLVIFTEFKDTLLYLAENIRVRLGKAEAVVEIHGGVKREDRRKRIDAFRNDPEVRVLVANDAAGEGVNLQRAHLMVNYDLPWNPNRLEQRFGRIHRIGQEEVCHLWNLVAKDTREGEVYERLLKKLEAEAEAFDGKVFDVIGQLFEQRTLRELLWEAIRYGDDPEVKARLHEKVEGSVAREKLQELLATRALVHDGMDASKVQAIKEEMERAHARRLQPHYVQSFFLEALRRLGGVVHPREPGRYEITHVPQAVRERDRFAGSGAPVLHRYERICFEKEHTGQHPPATLVCPGHPLLEAVIAIVIERFGAVSKQGAVLIDEEDLGTTPRMLFQLQHAIEDGRQVSRGGFQTVSQRLQFVEAHADGSFHDAGVAPYLDYRAASAPEIGFLQENLEAGWTHDDWDAKVVGYAVTDLVPKHLDDVKTRRLPYIAKVEQEVRARLIKEIGNWNTRAQELRLKERAGKKTRLPASQAEERARVLRDRLQQREAELALEKKLRPLPPDLQGGALVVPRGLLQALGAPGAPPPTPGDAADAAIKAETEHLAMLAVMAAERALGRKPRDVSAQKGLGYDIESFDPKSGSLVFIEVKGRLVGGDTVTLTRSEILLALNEPDQFRLAIVLVEDGVAREPVYVRGLDSGQPGFAQTSATYALKTLLEQGQPPH